MDVRHNASYGFFFSKSVRLSFQSYDVKWSQWYILEICLSLNRCVAQCNQEIYLFYTFGRCTAQYTTWGRNVYTKGILLSVDVRNIAIKGIFSTSVCFPSSRCTAQCNQGYIFYISLFFLPVGVRHNAIKGIFSTSVCFPSSRCTAQCNQGYIFYICLFSFQSMYGTMQSRVYFLHLSVFLPVDVRHNAIKGIFSTSVCFPSSRCTAQCNQWCIFYICLFSFQSVHGTMQPRVYFLHLSVFLPVGARHNAIKGIFSTSVCFSFQSVHGTMQPRVYFLHLSVFLPVGARHNAIKGIFSTSVCLTFQSVHGTMQSRVYFRHGRHVHGQRLRHDDRAVFRRQQFPKVQT